MSVRERVDQLYGRGSIVEWIVGGQGTNFRYGFRTCRPRSSQVLSDIFSFSLRLDDGGCDYHQKERFRQQWQLLSIHGGFQYPLGLRARSLLLCQFLWWRIGVSTTQESTYKI